MPVIFDIDEVEKTVAIGLVDSDKPEDPERFVVFIAGYDGIDMEPFGHVFGAIYDDDKNTSKLKVDIALIMVKHLSFTYILGLNWFVNLHMS